MGRANGKQRGETSVLRKRGRGRARRGDVSKVDAGEDTLIGSQERGDMLAMRRARGRERANEINRLRMPSCKTFEP
eukprot:scaffold207403_cov31-Tisochrysis_lutea.AAC.1